MPAHALRKAASTCATDSAVGGTGSRAAAEFPSAPPRGAGRAPPAQARRGRQLAHVGQEGLRRQADLEGEESRKAQEVEAPRKIAQRENDASVEANENPACVNEERLHADAVARGEQFPLARIPDREREHAVQARGSASPQAA